MAGDGWEEGGKERINTVVVKSRLDLCGKIKVVLLGFTKVESSVLPEPALHLSMEASCEAICRETNHFRVPLHAQATQVNRSPFYYSRLSYCWLKTLGPASERQGDTSVGTGSSLQGGWLASQFGFGK